METSRPEDRTRRPAPRQQPEPAIVPAAMVGRTSAVYTGPFTMGQVAEDVASFLESGVSIVVGTRDARGMPECTRAVGARVSPAGDRITLWLPSATAAVALDNLRDNGQLAASFSRPWDHRTLQIKGKLQRLGPARAAHRAAVERYCAALAGELERVGMPRHLTMRLSRWPAHAVEIRIEGIFDQTPGPGAGGRRG